MPLEHLVTAVNGASIQVSSNSGVKILVATSYESMLPDDVSYIYDVFRSIQRSENGGRIFPILPTSQLLSVQVLMFVCLFIYLLLS